MTHARGAAECAVHLLLRAPKDKVLKTPGGDGGFERVDAIAGCASAGQGGEQYHPGQAEANEMTTSLGSLDKLFYTDEEKAEDGRKERSEARGMIIHWMQATSGQNLARRLLALVITAVWLFMYISSAALDVAAVWLGGRADQLNTSSMLIGDRATEMNGAMMLILGFYFAAPHMGSIANKAMDRFSGKKKD